MPKKIVVIGAGASGLMAAVVAARQGAAVTVIEHKDKVGKKILMTGNGKCNLTNVSDFHGKYYGKDLAFIYRVLSTFTAEDTRHIFQEMGLYTKEKRDGGVYPVSEQAVSVLEVLKTECRHLHIKILTNCKVKNVQMLKDEGEIRLEQCAEDEKTLNRISFDELIIATGGKAAAVSGSDGSGYKLAEKLGHHIMTPLPALVQLRCEGKHFKMVAGVRAQAKLTLLVNGQETACEEGELQLTDYGISGIPVFQFSRIAACALWEKKKCEVRIHFLPFLTKEQIAQLEETYTQYGYKTMEEFLGGLVNKKIASLVCKQIHVNPQDKLETLSSKAVLSAINLLKDYPVVITATNPFENAQVSCGGVPVEEIEDTMESKLCPHVYFVGEILDCDGICGGYNLQWAWATGAIAGKHAAKEAGKRERA